MSNEGQKEINKDTVDKLTKMIEESGIKNIEQINWLGKLSKPFISFNDVFRIQIDLNKDERNH